MHLLELKVISQKFLYYTYNNDKTLGSEHLIGGRYIHRMIVTEERLMVDDDLLINIT